MLNPLNAEEIYQFVDRLAAQMRREGRVTFAERLERANKFYLPPLTSEYLGEVMLALKSILIQAESLSPEMRDRAEDYALGIQNRYFSRPQA